MNLKKKFVETVEQQVDRDPMSIPADEAKAVAETIKNLRQSGQQAAKKRWSSFIPDPSPKAARARRNMRNYRARLKAKEERT